MKEDEVFKDLEKQKIYDKIMKKDFNLLAELYSITLNQYIWTLRGNPWYCPQSVPYHDRVGRILEKLEEYFNVESE